MSDYRYIGKDGKTVLARDLEDERDALRARLADLEKLKHDVVGDKINLVAELRQTKAELATARRDAANIARSFSCCHVPDEIAALIAQEETTPWRPISAIDWKNKKEPVIGAYRTDAGRWICEVAYVWGTDWLLTSSGRVFPATKWMPLVSPPSQEEPTT